MGLIPPCLYGGRPVPSIGFAKRCDVNRRRHRQPKEHINGPWGAEFDLVKAKASGVGLFTDFRVGDFPRPSFSDKVQRLLNLPCFPASYLQPISSFRTLQLACASVAAVPNPAA